MAVDMFLDLTSGKINGESQVKGQDKKIDILAWSWGMSQSGTTHLGQGGGSGKVNVQDISITKYVDSSTHALMQKCCNGSHIAKGQIIVRKAGDKPIDYVVIDLEDIIITSVSSGGSGGEERLTENVSLNFSKFKYIYTPQKKDGSKDKSKEFGYDIAANDDA